MLRYPARAADAEQGVRHCKCKYSGEERCLPKLPAYRGLGWVAALAETLASTSNVARFTSLKERVHDRIGAKQKVIN